MTDKIKQAREDLTEKYFSHKRAGGISNETFETLVTALEKLEAIDGKALGEALKLLDDKTCDELGTYIYSSKNLDRPHAQAIDNVIEAARAVAEIKGE